MKRIVLAISILTSLTTTGAEVDAFTGRFQPLEDSLEKLNVTANEMMNDALEDANRRERGCNERILYRQLRKRFNNHYKGEFTQFVIESDLLERITTPSRKSVYRDFRWYEAIVQGGLSRISDPIAATIKVNNVMMGTDKFEHFMGSGYRYFQTHHVEGNPIEESLRIGWRAENGVLGAITTGVMSYADLSANFNGMRFWNHMLLKYDDVLGENIGPYIKCENNQWVATETKIDWANYIDDSYDEGINCSRYKNERMNEKVLKRLDELTSNDPEGRVYKCPMASSQTINKISERYGALTPFIVNSIGNTPLGVEEFDLLYQAP